MAVLTEARRSLRFFPVVADLYQIAGNRTALRKNAPREADMPCMPCSCSADELMALGGRECAHGSRYGLGGLRELLKPLSGESPIKPEVDVEKRRAELKAQAGKLQ